MNNFLQQATVILHAGIFVMSNECFLSRLENNFRSEWFCMGLVTDRRQISLIGNFKHTEKKDISKILPIKYKSQYMKTFFYNATLIDLLLTIHNYFEQSIITFLSFFKIPKISNMIEKLTILKKSVIKITSSTMICFKHFPNWFLMTSLKNLSTFVRKYACVCLCNL